MPLVQSCILSCLFSLILLVFTPMRMQAQTVSDPGTFGVERGTGAVICTGDADMAGGDGHSDDPSYALSAMWDQMVLGDTLGVCGNELRPLDNGTWGETLPFSGTDAEGRSADFRLYVLHDRYVWKLGSSREILDGDRLVQFQNVFTTPQFFSRFCAAKAVLSVGAASHEGPTQLNHQLAENRGQAVAGALQVARDGCSEGQIPILYAINLGEHRDDLGSGKDTSPQRRVVIVAAEDLTLGVNVHEALRQGLETQDIFSGVSLNDYDLFELDAF